MNKSLSHINAKGEAHMVDVGEKNTTHRIAKVSGLITMQAETLDVIEAGKAKKGDVLATARIAGIMAAKKTSDIIPLCHPLPLTSVNVDIVADRGLPGYRVGVVAKVNGQTGVEMEALTACSVVCLTIYDMCKAIDRGMVIGEIKLLEKSGGKSDHWKLD